jgi:choline dehydrogenase-like flavoprotein
VPLKASGVEFASAAGGTARFTALARREVIIAGGAIQVGSSIFFLHLSAKLHNQTPALLQLSGIGDSAILGPLGIKTEIDLKTVGRNLQEQVRCSTISYEAGVDPIFLQTMNSLGANGNGFDKGGRGPSDCIAFPNIYQLFGSQASAKVSQIQSSLATWATSQATSALSAAALQTIFQVQADLIINKNGTAARLLRGK